MEAISLNMAASLVGVSKRTLWRHIDQGTLHAISAETPGEKTQVPLDEVLAMCALTLEAGDRDTILAADAGEAEAQCALGVLLLGAEQPCHAAPVLTLAARQLHLDAMCWLGRMSLGGWGIKRDLEQGLMWLSHAAVKGHGVARALTQFLQSDAGQALCAGDDPAALDAALDDIERAVLLEALERTAA